VTPELVETSLDVPKAEALRILADARVRATRVFPRGLCEVGSYLANR
jgi:hypothetical protein